ncbi:MAG: hypothetical protein MI919_19380 [Holophagales bacterium]|nr:hypothetical protein [Holophagales bacterium]
MRRFLIVFLTVAIVLAQAPAAGAAFRENLTESERWKELRGEVDRLLVTVPECHLVMDCSKLREKIHERVADDGPKIRLVGEAEWREYLFGLGKTSYTPELRAAAMEHFEVAAIAEIKILDARRSEGFGSATRSVVNLELTIYDADGAVLIHASGTGKPKNVVSGPEKVGGRVVGRILKKAFGR